MLKEIFQTISGVHLVLATTVILVSGTEFARTAYDHCAGARHSYASSVRAVSPSMPSFVSLDKFQPRHGWRKVTQPLFSYWLPPDMKDGEHGGIDSAVWRYQSKRAELTIDFGWYSGKSAWSSYPEYREDRTVISKVKAILCSYREAEAGNRELPYIHEANFHDFDDPATGLTFRYYGRSMADQGVARQIFSSISFHPELLKH